MKAPDLTSIEFYHDEDYEKLREFGAGVTYKQRGVLFSSGFKAIKILEVISDNADDIDNMSVAEMRAKLRSQKLNEKPRTVIDPERQQARTAKKAGKKSSVRKRADSKLQGFKDEENPDYVREALGENAAAKRAEDNAA